MLVGEETVNAFHRGRGNQSRTRYSLRSAISKRLIDNQDGQKEHNRLVRVEQQPKQV